MQRAVAFLHFDQEIHAGRAVKLADDDALSAVDDELTAADHDGDFAQVDGIFHHLILVLADQAHLDAEGHAEGEAQGAALIGGVARLSQIVADVFQLEILVVAFDGEDLAQEGLQAIVLAFVDLHFLLEEPLIRLDLDVDQVRNGKRVAALAKVADFMHSH